MRGPTHLLYLLMISLVTTDGLRVTMKTPLISVMRDADVTIPCEISEFSPDKKIAINWSKSQNGGTSEVYRYVTGQEKDFRPGAYMEEESEIQRGNATLHIPRVQYTDDGEYTCTAIVTPESREGKSNLQVSAVPSAVLVPGDAIIVELGSEKSVSCEVTNFYPKDINVRWVRYEKDSSKCVVLERGTCTGDNTNNTDGTFSLTSHLTLYPTMEDDGCRYSCLVKHRSLEQDLKMNFTLTVTERVDNTGKVVAAVIVTFLIMTLLLLAGFLYFQVFRKDPPILSEISGNDRLIDMSRTTLTCHITNFKPDDLEISVCLKRRGEEMMRTIHTWRSGDSAPVVTMADNDGDNSVVIDVEEQRLMNGSASHTQGPLQLEMTPVISSNRSSLLRCIPWHRLSTYSCQCSVHITPSHCDDDEAEFSVHVSHPALTAAISQKRTLRVIGVAPKLSQIFSPVYMTHEEPMMLTCPINAFKPKPLQIRWVKKDQSDQETEIITWDSNRTDTRDENHNVTEIENEDKSYSFQSAITIRPNVREDGVTYICKTFHPVTGHRAEKELVLNITALPVLDPIKQTLLHAGDKMGLYCKIHSFYPAPIEVTWYTEDGRMLPSDISDLPPEQSGLHQVTSTMTYSPTMKDLKKTFTCQVRHQSTGALRTATWTLEDLVSEPKVSEIRCFPPSPRCDNMVTLSCDIADMFPRDFSVQWHKGRHRMSPEMYRETFREDPESGTFQGTVELKFPADSGCHEEEYRMELIHCGKTIVRKYRLILEGFLRSLILSDIISDPRSPSYGQSVTLSCKVTNANPQDITVMWLKGEKPLKRVQGEEKKIPEKDGSLSCSLRVTPTALDYGKAYTCSVTHKDLKEPLRKNYYISLPDKAPVFSDITVRPGRPVAGKEAIFTVTISGFTPDIKVKWYKDFSPFPSSVVSTSDPQIGDDFLCTCTSSLRFTPQDNDNMVSIRCEAAHSVTKKVHAKSYTSSSTSDPRELKSPLKTKGIQCLTERPRVGEEVTLACYIDGCDADSSDFFWKKGLFDIDGEIQNRNLEDGTGSFSTVTFTAQETDRDCTITCEVSHDLQTKQEHFTLRLQ